MISIGFLLKKKAKLNLNLRKEAFSALADHRLEELLEAGVERLQNSRFHIVFPCQVMKLHAIDGQLRMEDGFAAGAL